MTGLPDHAGVGRQLTARPCFERGQLRQVRPRDLVLRFTAGAATSAVAGALTLAFGARTGGP
ncbi:MAG: hypothetical protein ACYC91_09335 [Solirubrobacteraceae bacterium]